LPPSRKTKVFLHELVDLASQAGERFGDLEVVFVGDDDLHGPYIQAQIDLAVCMVTEPDGSTRQVFALILNAEGKTPGLRTLMQ
jgi:hypothetical protein